MLALVNVGLLKCAGKYLFSTETFCVLKTRLQLDISPHIVMYTFYLIPRFLIRVLFFEWTSFKECMSHLVVVTVTTEVLESICKRKSSGQAVRSVRLVTVF